jgi:patatin-like phospholipase/acyl hydrolase|tara:strand:+ start:710 stop:967 length:258 start_codon:yes stop_codon:yes gene_type:complete
MKIKTKDEIVKAVIDKLDNRSLVGQKKYGSTMSDEIKNNKKDFDSFLVDVQEEIMDALLYIEAARRCLQDEVEEVYLKQINEKEI